MTIYICDASLHVSQNYFSRTATKRVGTPSLSGSSVRVVEAAFVRCGVSAGILETAPGVIGEDYPLTNANPTRLAQLEAFDMLQTTPEGIGWRESGEMRYGQAPLTSPYIDCQNRQLFETPLDEITDMDKETINVHLAAWNTRHALYRFITCLSRGRVQRTPMVGMESAFDIC